MKDEKRIQHSWRLLLRPSLHDGLYIFEQRLLDEEGTFLVVRWDLEV